MTNKTSNAVVRTNPLPCTVFFVLLQFQNLAVSIPSVNGNNNVRYFSIQASALYSAVMLSSYLDSKRTNT